MPERCPGAQDLHSSVGQVGRYQEVEPIVSRAEILGVLTVTCNNGLTTSFTKGKGGSEGVVCPTNDGNAGLA